MFTTSRLRIGSVVALTLMAPAAFAGGYVAPVVPGPVIVAPEVQTQSSWAGAYGGVALGYAFGSDDRVGVRAPTGGPAITRDSADISGIDYGVQLGYRWQTQMSGRQIVIGPELSYEKSSADASFDTDGVTATSEMDTFMALRVKAGVLTGAGDSMIYGIAGVGRGDFNYTVVGDGMDYAGSYSDNAWILGLGAERKVSERMSVFGEWEFRGTGKTALTDDAGYVTQATPEHHHLKVGVNFSF
ncbi:outer membrane protein [Paracoccus tegillarcae]|uniref:Porin family protein n=1 Tax=Paracoccus tegillarcae TaxID=1529068 RepID=A0A2K9EZ80_9RHOB|nr:outer membrane beta-barrel protein [Paracoccus tegillarcae]AUH33412.1 porin family protein [Paracoccus tegillarcae]